MKALQLVCISTLLLKNSPAAAQALHYSSSSSSRAFSFRWHPSSSCRSRPPTWPWFNFNFKGNWASPHCKTSAVGQHNSCCLHCRMADSGFDSLKHSVQRLKDVPTVSDLMDVVVAGKRQDAAEHVIFFGGDVQDYPENMQRHRDNGRYVRWNSLWTADHLCERFPESLVLVMKPHHMHLNTFSVYSQFVQSNEFGCPTHTPDFGAWHTLAKVYKEAVRRTLASNRLAPAEEDVLDSAATPQILTVPVHLIGFSKGCIVLNQLVHELGSVLGGSDNNHAADSDYDRGSVQSFLSQVRAMTWLDGGHSGGSNTWVTDQASLDRLAGLGLNIHVHVTPYQVKDPMRRWIGKEQRKFVELLRKAGARVTDKIHFEDEPRSIENHFMVLEMF